MSDDIVGTVKTGDVVSIHYKGTLSDGVQFDSSYDRGEPISTTVGSRTLIPGFDDALVGMEVGTVKSITIPASEAYGERHDEARAELAKTVFPPEFASQISEGSVIPLSNSQEEGSSFPATAIEIKEDTIVFDLNHPMAGKELNFDIEVVGFMHAETETEA
tara:strand:+ start:1291 stop:1773 length:483 start_codon:yes stop_codon:yes gene_type:complete